MPKVSIIIPFFNQGYCLSESIDSALSQNFDDYDIIIVNDGSTDPISNRIFQSISDPKIQKIETENQGLSAARNTAVKRSTAEFILPLDSDDRLHPDYLKKAVQILEEHKEVGIVYPNVELFGEEQGVWQVEPYSFPEILTNPQIIASSLYRKSDWETVGGYKSDMIYGWEDYDFWLSLIELGREVYHIPEVLFYYRQTEGSMAGLDRGKMLYSFEKLFQHHKELYEKNIKAVFNAAIDGKPHRERIASNEVFELHLPDSSSSGGNVRSQHYKVGAWSRIEFQIAESISERHAIRFDPGSKIGVFDIASVKVFNATNFEEIYKADSPKAFSDIALSGSALALSHDRFLRILNTEYDPYFYLPLEAEKLRDLPIVLEIWIRFKPNLSGLSVQNQIQPTSNQQLLKIRDLEEALRFQKEQETLLKYQEVSLREELQNLRNERAVILSEVNNAQASAKSLQAELFALQNEHRRLIQRRDELEKQVDELGS